MILEVRHLRVIEAIAAEGRVSKAARRLHLTQPAVSHALRSLEDRLGVRLFARRRQGMVPTADGERLLLTAASVLDQLERAERELHSISREGVDVLRITTQCYSSYHWLPGVLKLFQRDFPQVELQIVPAASRRPIEALLDDQIDLAVITGDPGQPGVALEALFSDEMVAIVPPGHELAERHHLEAADFADQHLVTHPDSSTSFLFTRVLTPARISPRRVSEFPLSEAVVETVKAGLGISVIPRWAVDPDIASGALKAVSLTAAGIRPTWSAAMLEHLITDRVVRELLYHLRCCAFGPAHGGAGT